MSTTVLDADVRGFYAALGLPLSAHAAREAPVRCFANPWAHNDGDPIGLGLAGLGAHGAATAAAPPAAPTTPRSPAGTRPARRST
jgi:hypothetical protein